MLPIGRSRKAEYERHLSKMRSRALDNKDQRLESGFNEAMLGAAQIMLDEIPSLQKGVFWYTPPIDHAEHNNIWYKYTYYRQNTEGGESVATIDPYVEAFSDNWMINLDGQKETEYEAANDAWESDSSISV
ncbi:uncharacterized protein IL334_007159 [Kwoniella shivajii]|uniref:Uncharacterized protein n=1 Tax=Kwoniella shivajii TaxID=564305 RepID=A0ABZ1D7W7_9TREE|nr:hypothetical protein IL334_007159 [Kwoniella shivajii]